MFINNNTEFVIYSTVYLEQLKKTTLPVGNQPLLAEPV